MYIYILHITEMIYLETVPTVIRQATTEDIEALITIMNEYIGDFYQKPKPPVESCISSSLHYCKVKLVYSLWSNNTSRL